MKPVDLRLKAHGRSARLTNQIDAESLRFEEELRSGIELALPQRQHYLASCNREFRLFQMRGVDGKPAMQIAIYVYRASRFKSMSRAIAHRMAKGTSPAEERIALMLLRKLCARTGDLLTLRLQPIRTQAGELDQFAAHALSAGFASTSPLSYTHTLLCEVKAPLEELALALSKKTRSKIRHRTRDEVELRSLTDPKYIPQCQAALQASFTRTGGGKADYDFKASFDLARAHPERVSIFGVFLPHRPDELLAFVIGRHGGGSIAEYSAAGSHSDPELRRFPFNYFLVWELIQWAHGNGAHWLDLGGITQGGADDPRASISEFKRHLCENEIEISRESLAVLQPLRTLIFECLIRLRLLVLDRAAVRPGGRFRNWLAGHRLSQSRADVVF